jgi:hypothetical protein
MIFYIFKGDGNSLYSPEFGRGALDGAFALRVYQIFSTPTITVTLEGRAANATSWANIGSFASITTIGVKTATIGGLPEVLRYRFDVAGPQETSGAAIELYASQWMS